MHGPVTPERYRSIALREHLVSQYCLGTLSLRTRKRLEALMAADMSWYEQVAQWHSRLDEVAPMVTDTPPAWVWTHIAATLDGPKQPPAKAGFWGKYRMRLSLAGVALVMLLSSPLFLITAPEIITPSYVAVMSSAGEKSPFVLLAYQGAKPGTSSMRLEWNARHSLSDGPDGLAMLWAKNKETGKVIPLGRVADVQKTKTLTPAEWQAVKTSSELFITVNNNPDSPVLFNGVCIELASSLTST